MDFPLARTRPTSPFRPTVRISPASFVVLLAPAVLALSLGCENAPPPGAPSGGQAAGGGTEGGTTAVATLSAPATPPPVDGWDQPALALLFSGEQHGYIEPCGCSETQSGGLARRYDLFKQLEAKGWPVVGMDLGGTLKRTRRQSELKLQFTRRALNKMAYAGLGLGPEEVHLGPDRLFTAHSETSVEDDFDVPFLAANVTIYGGAVDTPVPFRVVEKNGVRVGVTAVLGDKHESAFQGDAGVMEIKPAAASLTPVVEQLQAENCDVLVLLSHAPPADTKALIEQFPLFDVVVTAEGPEDPDPKPETVGENGRTLLLRVSQKGKSVGVVGVYPQENATPGLKFELVNLDKDRFETSPELVEMMREYQEQLKQEDLSVTEPAVTHPSGTGYVGAKTCGKCHTKAYGIWSKTRHAHAFESLAEGRKDTKDWWVNRQHDAECLACHVTGWEPQEIVRFETGFESEEATPHLAGQQCENCHGPGAAHSELEFTLRSGGDFTDAHREQRQAMHLDKKTAEMQVCSKCHDLDNSPNFNFELYWPKVVHSGRD